MQNFKTRAERTAKITKLQEEISIVEETPTDECLNGEMAMERLENGTVYFFVDREGFTDKDTEAFIRLDRNTFLIGNYFATREDAQNYADYLKSRAYCIRAIEKENAKNGWNYKQPIETRKGDPVILVFQSGKFVPSAQGTTVCAHHDLFMCDKTSETLAKDPTFCEHYAKMLGIDNYQFNQNN